MKSKLFLTLAAIGVLASLTLAAGYAVYADDQTATTTDQTATTTVQTNEIEDVAHQDVNVLPANLGKFVLMGLVTAVDASSSTISVNGFAINVASDAKIRRGRDQTLASVVVGDRVLLSGNVADGKLTANRVVVAGFVKKVVQEEVFKQRREELNKKIQGILEQVNSLRKTLKEKWGVE